MPILGTLINQLGKLEDKKAELKKQLKAVEEKYNAKEKELEATMKELGTHSASGNAYGVERVVEEYPTVEDWNKTYAFIKRNNAWDLLQRRISTRAWNDRREKRPVPGITSFRKFRLKLKKL